MDKREEEIRKLCDGATAGTWRWGVVDRTLGLVEWFKAHISFGSGDCHCVWIEGHPRATPGHSVLAAITGNGPDSEKNAKFIISARDGMRYLLDRLTAAEAALAEANAALSGRTVSCSKCNDLAKELAEEKAKRESMRQTICHYESKADSLARQLEDAQKEIAETKESGMRFASMHGAECAKRQQAEDELSVVKAELTEARERKKEDFCPDCGFQLDSTEKDVRGLADELEKAEAERDALVALLSEVVSCQEGINGHEKCLERLCPAAHESLLKAYRLVDHAKAAPTQDANFPRFTECGKEPTHAKE